MHSRLASVAKADIYDIPILYCVPQVLVKREPPFFFSMPISQEESIDWLSTIINDEVVDHGNRSDACDGGGGGVAGSGGNGKLVGDLTCEGRESNGRLPNFHQAFGSTEIGRFSQHEYYEPPKDTAIGECQSAGRAGSAAAQQPGVGTSQRSDEQHAAAAASSSSSSLSFGG